MNRIIERLKRTWAKRGQTKEVETKPVAWSEIGVPEPIVRQYFARHGDEELDVPLAIARQVREEIVSMMANNMDAEERLVAVWQGIIAGMERFAKIYQRGVEMQREKIGPGGKRNVKGFRA